MKQLYDMKKILSLLLGAASLTATAQTDVTADYLKNYGFDSGFHHTAGQTTKVDKEIKVITGWTAGFTVDYTITGIYQYGFAGTFNGGEVPAQGYQGSEGGALALSTGWGVEMTCHPARRHLYHQRSHLQRQERHERQVAAGVDSAERHCRHLHAQRLSLEDVVAGPHLLHADREHPRQDTDWLYGSGEHRFRQFGQPAHRLRADSGTEHGRQQGRTEQDPPARPD